MKKFFSNKCNYSKELRDKTKLYFENNINYSLKFIKDLGPIYNIMLLKNIKRLKLDNFIDNEYLVINELVESLKKNEFHFWLYTYKNSKFALKNMTNFKNFRSIESFEKMNYFFLNRFYIFDGIDINNLNNIFYQIKDEFKSAKIIPLVYTYNKDNKYIIGKNFIKDLNYELPENIEVTYDVNFNKIEIINKSENKKINLLYYEQNNQKNLNEIINHLSIANNYDEILILNDIDIKNEKNINNFYISDLLKGNEENIEFDDFYFKINNKNDYNNYIQYIKNKYKIDDVRRLIVEKNTEKVNFSQSLTYSILNQVYDIDKKSNKISLFKSYEINSIYKFIQDKDFEYFKNLYQATLDIENHIVLDYSSNINMYGCSFCNSYYKKDFFIKEDILKYSKFNEFYKYNIKEIINKLIKNKNIFNNSIIIIPKVHLTDYITSILDHFKNPDLSLPELTNNSWIKDDNISKLVLLSKSFNINSLIVDQLLSSKFKDKYNSLKSQIDELSDKNNIFNLQFINKKSKSVNCDIIKKI